ncbi:MAG: MBL fold metallo-hydrolase [Acidobacteria bacterium]|uniref:MBL fold metallo-hydrolase n=1 Tax=Candidatus Sulfomarinibacter kjeldsenii TaxID=2885994 RepID=A0A8J7C4L9_9BACT|nr:MBL fold metallo-hydrolase [Candidatus Sulfomarinibacter kjeldsenii]
MQATKLRRLRLPTSWGELIIVGGSRAGDGTVILLPQLHLALDAGRAHRALPAMTTVVVSHGHVDHLGGIAYWASQRQLQSMGPARLLAPGAIAPGIEGLLATHANLEGGQPYEVEMVPVEAGERFSLRRDFDLVFFPTDHWVPTLGSRLVWRRHRLLSEYAALSGEEIAHRRSAGVTITEEIETNLLAYCADCGPGVLENQPQALAAEVLLIECSFYRSRDRERAVRYGHMHLDDMLESIDRLSCRHLVLLHPSRRHRLREVEEILADRLRPRLDCSLHHLMIDWD